MVHTICDELKYGASNLLAPNSTAITDIPAKNSVRYKNILFRKILNFIYILSSLFDMHIYTEIYFRSGYIYFTYELKFPAEYPMNDVPGILFSLATLHTI